MNGDRWTENGKWNTKEGEAENKTKQEKRVREREKEKHAPKLYPQGTVKKIFKNIKSDAKYCQTEPEPNRETVIHWLCSIYPIKKVKQLVFNLVLLLFIQMVQQTTPPRIHIQLEPSFNHELVTTD